MMDFLLLIFSQSQLDRFAELFQWVSNGGFSFKRITAVIVLVVQFFTILIDSPEFPMGAELNLSDYSLVFCDEFDGTQLDTNVWDYRATGSRRGGFNSPKQVKVENGNLVITGEYRENGEFGSGWYGGMINLKKRYKNGYFEIKCICNESKGFWSAFWLQSSYAYKPEMSKGGIGGAEIDIFESLGYGNYNRLRHFGVSHAIHCSGMEGDDSGELNSKNLGWFYGKNIYKEFNTYGLEWTEDEYIFYVNGVETTRSTWADGVSTDIQEVIVSLEIPEDMDKNNYDKTTFKTRYVVDYVKIYQK